MAPTRFHCPPTLALCCGYFLVLLDVTVVTVVTLVNVATVARPPSSLAKCEFARAIV